MIKGSPIASKSFTSFSPKNRLVTQIAPHLTCWWIIWSIIHATKWLCTLTLVNGHRRGLCDLSNDQVNFELKKWSSWLHEQRNKWKKITQTREENHTPCLHSLPLIYGEKQGSTGDATFVSSQPWRQRSTISLKWLWKPQWLPHHFHSNHQWMCYAIKHSFLATTIGKESSKVAIEGNASISIHFIGRDIGPTNLIRPDKARRMPPKWELFRGHQWLKIYTNNKWKEVLNHLSITLRDIIISTHWDVNTKS